MLAVSTDDAETLRRFKKSLQATHPFVSDPQGVLVRRFGVKAPVLNFARRFTFVIGEGREVLEVQAGQAALDPSGAIAACPIRRRQSPKPAAEPPHEGQP